MWYCCLSIGQVTNVRVFIMILLTSILVDKILSCVTWIRIRFI